MNSLFFRLLCALVLPPAGRILTGRAGRRKLSWVRAFKLAWTILSIYAWARLALMVGDRAGHASPGNALLVLLAGFLYFEVVALTAGPVPPAHSPGARLMEGEEEGEPPVPPEAEALLDRIRSLEHVTCASIMVPRDRIVWVDASASVGQALARMRAAGRSRVVVVGGGSLDRVLGIAHAKDLLPQALESGEGSSVRRHLRRWLRVSQEETAARLLDEFRRHRVHLAVVGDPMGRTLGLVTLGDVFHILAGFDEPAPGAGGADQAHRGGGRP